MDLVTCFKNKNPIFFTYYNFYKEYWKVNNFYFIVGYTNDNNKKYIMDNYIGNITYEKKCNKTIDKQYIENIEIFSNDKKMTFILYKTDPSPRISLSTWDTIKSSLVGFFYSQYPHDEIISIDSDELIYIKDINNLKYNHRFHYVEIMLNDTFDINDDLEWCLQSWCNIKYFGQGKKTQDCSSCKVFNFKHSCNKFKINKRMLSFRHAGSILYNESACKHVIDKTIDLDNALDKGICFHFLAFTRSQLASVKEKRWNNKWDSFFENEKILKDIYGTVVCNILKYYIDCKDLIELNRL